MSKFLFFLFIIISFDCTAQKIYGTIFNDKGDLLAYSSVTIKGTTTGASANNRAKFLINLAPGTYTVVCQHIGYIAQEKKITLAAGDEELFFVLQPQKLQMKDVIVKAGGEDPAYAIIRSAIKKRPYYQKEVKAFECDLYAKDMIKLRRLPKKIFGKKIPEEDRQDMGLDTMGAGIIYLSESIAKVSTQQPDKFKMEVKSSRLSGSSGFGFTFPTFISLYQNNVTVFTEKFNPRGFVSPIANGAIGFYKYKFLGSFWEDGKEINSIRVIPRRNYEPLFSGVINITEGDWRIHSVDLVLTKKSQLEILDTLKITQFHVPAGKETWRVKNQLLHFNFNQFGIDAVGNFVNVYSNYKIDPAYPKGFFDRVIIKYDTGISKKPKVYWDSIRPVPLEKEEVNDYQVKDSLYEMHKDSIMSSYKIDSLKKRQGKIKPYEVIWDGIHRTHYSKKNTYNWGIESLLKHFEYNPAEGAVGQLSGYYEKDRWRSGTNLSIRPNIRYGFSNTHLNAWVDVVIRTRDWGMAQKLKRHTWSISAGKRVSEFNKDNPQYPWVNTIGTLLYGSNYTKTYENYFGSIGFSKRYESGLRFSINSLYEDRIPLDNTTNFTFRKRDSSRITPNYPYEKITSQFNPHQAFIVDVEISMKPGQRYIQFPFHKVPVGSKYPTLTFNYSKGFRDIFGSDVNFDKWKFTVSDDKNFKLAGLMKYKLGIGGFLNNQSVFIQDYQHFNGNQSVAASEYVNSFQLAKYYANSTTASLYGFGHLEHHFNGLLTNKIPFFNRLNWNLVAGSNAFYVNANSNYVEIFAGLENILKIFRVDFVAAFENGRRGITGIRIGTGGLIGGSINANGSTTSKGRNMSISF